MKNNELNNKENMNGFGMSNEEMNQIVGGTTFMCEADLSGYCSTVSFGEQLTNDNAMGCWICETGMIVINGCQEMKK